MSIPNAAVTFPDATRTENTRCGSMDLSATGQTQPSALRLNCAEVQPRARHGRVLVPTRGGAGANVGLLTWVRTCSPTYSLGS